MTPSQRLEILRAALALEPEEQAAFLAEACQGNQTLYDEVKHLLALDAQEDTLLDGGADPLAMSLMADLPEQAQEFGIQPGDQVGPWLVLEHLGSGGMGSVWLAERQDGQLIQQVALKCIKPGMDSAAVLRSFQRERDLLIRLQHPGIASLIDSGMDERGRPWYAMRHVEGIPLDEWLKTSPGMRERLGFFLALCRIVAYAHQQLVVHRDLKPANVMVQLDGSPCLLDFGIAKILRDGQPEATATVARFASTAYAAPEQLQGGEVSTATDVYALGAIFFELLTGKRYSQVNGQDITVTRPSRIAALGKTGSAKRLASRPLQGDLDAIAMQALAPEPARRYRSAEALADDVERYLHGHPVRARPDGALYRWGKWLQRNRLAASGVLLAILALLGGTVISLWQAHRATLEAERAEAVKYYLIGLFDAGRSNSEGAQVLDRRVGDLLEDSARSIQSDLYAQPDLRDEIYGILIEIFDANASGNRSLELAQERLTQAETAFGVDDPRIVPALLMLSGVLLNHDQPEGVPVLLQRAETLLAGAGRHDRLSQALLYRYQGLLMDDEEQAVARLRQSAEILRRDFPDSDELLITLFNLAQTTAASDNPVLQKTAYSILGELRERTRKKYGDQYQSLAQAEFIEARLLLQQGQAEAALPLIRHAIEQFIHFGGEHHNDVLISRFYEIRALLALQRIEEARSAWQQAEIQRNTYFSDNPELAEAFAGLQEKLEQADTTPAAQ